MVGFLGLCNGFYEILYGFSRARVLLRFCRALKGFEVVL